MKIKKIIPLQYIFLFTAINFSCNQNKEKAETSVTENNTNEQAVQPPQKPVDKNLLIGDWTRTDAPYQVKITELLTDGNMKAGYFNPKSINVGKATWTMTDSILKIYIELRDENYPGSNYTLIYYPEKDLLAGKYFQAVESVIYDVGFLRTK